MGQDPLACDRLLERTTTPARWDRACPPRDDPKFAARRSHERRRQSRHVVL